MNVSRITFVMLCLLLCFAFVLATPGWWGVLHAQPTTPVEVPTDRPLTIDDAVALALQHHPSLSIDAHRVTASRGTVIQTRSARLPSLDLRSSYGRSMSSGTAVVGGVPVEGGSSNRYATQYSMNLSANQLLYDFGRTPAEIRRAREELRVAEHSVAQTEDDVINNARQIFLTLCTNQELLEVARYRVRLQEDTLQLTTAQYESDLVPRADVAKAASALAAARLEVTSAQNAVAASRISLNEAMGIDVRTTYAVVAPPLPQLPPLSVETLIGLALEHRPELLAARAEIAAAEASLTVARKAQKPTLSVSASYGRRDDSFLPGRDNWDIGLSISQSLFDGHATRGQVIQARAQRDSARKAEFQTAQLVTKETAQALLDLQTAQEKMRSAESSVTSAQEDLELANGRYAAAVGILLEVLDAQAALTAAQASLATARYNYLSAFYALEHAIGISLAEAGLLLSHQ
ncbi:MAG: TolC family protein [Candidatus Zipacnadales bacterium]